MNLASRLFLVIAVLIVLAMGTAIGVTYWLGRAAAAEESGQVLANSQSVQRFFQRRSLRELELVTESMVADPAFVSYISQAMRREGGVDSRSIADLLGERSVSFGFDIALVLDADGTLLTTVGEGAPVSLDPADQPLVVAVLESYTPVSGLLLEGETIFQAAVVPMIRGRTVEGIVVVGKRVDADLIDDIARVSTTDLAYVPLTDGAPAIAATTLPGARTGTLAAELAAHRTLLERVRTTGESERLALLLEDGRWEALVAPLTEERAQGVLLSMLPSERLFGTFRNIANVMLLSGAVALALALVLSIVIARRFAQPIRQLTDTAQRAAEGEYANRIELRGHGEIGQLERAFNRLVVELREHQAVESYFRELWQRRSRSAIARRSGDVDTGVEDGWDHGPGDVIGGRYEVIRNVGRGGAGVVYEVHDRELNEVVALKTLKPSVVEDPGRIERLKSEIRLARRIAHPNVVRTYDFALVDGRAMISMEYVRGITLRQAIDESGRVEYHAAMRLARQIVSGIAAAHRAGVLHRDIKPGNIILNYSAKVMDFGIAHPANRPFSGRREDGSLEGTPEFMAPEQIAGKAVDARSDIYALGVVLMELFTGALPHHESDTMDTIVSHIKRKPHAPSAYWPDIPPALESIILRCLEKSPKKRFQAADELYDALVEIARA